MFVSNPAVCGVSSIMWGVRGFACVYFRDSTLICSIPVSFIVSDQANVK
jgi:hypothetical protein